MFNEAVDKVRSQDNTKNSLYKKSLRYFKIFAKAGYLPVHFNL